MSVEDRVDGLREMNKAIASKCDVTFELYRMLPTMWPKKINKLDDSKKISILKKGIGIEGEKIIETS